MESLRADRERRICLAEGVIERKLLSQRSSGELCQAAFEILKFFSEVKSPASLLRTVGVSAKILIFSCWSSCQNLFSELFKLVVGRDKDQQTFPRYFNVEYRWCFCGESIYLTIPH